MRIAEYLRRTGASDVPDVVFTCTCEWFPPPLTHSQRTVVWDAGCPVRDEDPQEEW